MELYRICEKKQNDQIDGEIIEVEEKIKYLEAKGKDVETIWKICSTFLAILIPISAIISFDTIEKLVEIDNNILKLLFVGGVIVSYLFFVLLFVSFINIQNVKLYNYNLYKRVLTDIQKNNEKEKKTKKNKIKKEKRKTINFILDIIYYPEKYDLQLGNKISIDEFSSFIREAGYKVNYGLIVEIVVDNFGLRFNPAKTYIIIDRNEINKEIRNKRDVHC